jgi:hypothetical protein
LAEVSIKGAVAGGIVGLVVLPAAPDHERPGAGKHANRLWVAHASAAGAGIDVGGPGLNVAGVVVEVGQRPAQLGVDLEAEADGAVFAGLLGERADPGRCRQGLRFGIAAAGAADLDRQRGGTNPSGARQAGEDRRVRVQCERLLLYGG